jgi:hypothetical protein
MSARVARSCSTSASHACVCTSTSIRCAAPPLASTASPARAAGSSPSASASVSASSVPGEATRQIGVDHPHSGAKSLARSGKRTCRIEPTPHAQPSHMHATVALCTSERRSFVLRRRTSLPASAKLGAARPMDTWNIDSNASGIKGHNETNLRDRTQCRRCIRFPIRAATFASGARRAKLGEPGFKRNRRDSGTFEWRKFGLRRHRPALVIFVRVRVVGSWQERFDTLFEHSMPQHKTARLHTCGR